ncbi:hypothetical protein RDWZM_005724 [Blomia tropicalis]|uniref:Gamma-interferon-inducible lysosomal thiol reductase n=1 Tax=Blomia tropicalis TaxID=40697 RepID=A0A9Q0M8B8_BLOTA|nr:antigen processing and presentation of exogenous peptide antigen via MHC class I [Blomia tropicalis]KAJ6219912.1 hypothetical protein RDWZM_005724 [Blomia tropicalis]
MKIQLILLAALLGCAVAQSNKPTISLYYEALCPYCRQFFVEQLAPAYDQLKDYFIIELVPFGNVQVRQDWNGNYVYQCQHGEAECYGNVVQSCAIKLFNYDQWFAFTRCMMQPRDYQYTTHYAQQCAQQLKLDWNSLSSCANGPDGSELMKKNWSKTYYLNPRKGGVPWILVNGQHTDYLQNNAQSDLIGFLCDDYLSNQNIPACNN